MPCKLPKKIDRVVKVGILGLGTVGSGAAKILIEHSDLIALRAMPIKLIRVVDKDIPKAQKLLDSLGLNDIPVSDNWQDLVNDDSIDIMIEVVGGIQMPYEAISAALKKGKSVVTANKDLIASHGGELLSIAEEFATDLFFEASVAGGIPIIQVMKESLAANRFVQIMGIVNGTTNYILTSMAEKGASFEEALQEAQKLGYAEADPTNDVEGYDAARKIAILASIAFNSRVTDDMVPVEGITHISDWDIKYATEFGYVIKMLGIAKEDENGIEVRVHPAMIPQSHPLASVRDSFNAIFVEGDVLGEAMFFGRGAGSLPTGSAIVGDVIAAARNICHNSKSRWGCTCFMEKKVKTIDQTNSKYYVRIKVFDQPGVFAAITKILGEENVSMDSVMQKRRISEDKAEIVLVTHQVNHADMMRSIDRIRNLSCVANIANIIRVEEREA